MRIFLFQRQIKDDRGDFYWEDYHLPHSEFEEWSDFQMHMERHYDPGLYRIVYNDSYGTTFCRKFRLKAVTTTTMVGVDE